MKKLILALALIGVAGCAGLAQRQAPPVDAEKEAVSDALADQKLHCQAQYAEHSLDSIRGKVGFKNDSETTMDMLIDTSRPTPPERTALIALSKMQEFCYRSYISIAESHPRFFAPELTAYEQASYPRFQFLLVDLINGALTYGEFGKKRREFAGERTQKREEIKQLLAQRNEDARYRAAALTNDARKAAALEEQAQAQRQQAAAANRPPQINVPQPITCVTNYNITTCR